MTKQVEVGDKAPEFTLLREWTGEPGESITLSDKLKEGPVVLAFYPADFSTPCRTELKTFRDSMEEYKKMGVNVLAISVDGIFSHAAFKEQNDFQFPLLSDWQKEVIEQYGVVWEDLAGMKNVANRAVFVIDNDGKVTYTWRSEDPTNMPPFDEVKEAVNKLQ